MAEEKIVQTTTAESAEAVNLEAVDAQAVIVALRAQLGDSAILTGADVQQRAAGIWRRDTIAAKAIIRPTTTAQVATAMRICYEHDQPVVAQGGLTGLVESGLTSPNEIALSLELMNEIEELDSIDRTMLVQSGVVLQHIQESAEAVGLMFPLDLGGRGSATIGGNIATNAGGNRVLRYGMARDMVLGLEVVLADGQIITSLNRMIKNNAGYDLKQLFIGSEGSLGIVTRALLRLREKPQEQPTLLAAVPGFSELAQFLKHMDASLGGTLSAFEVMWNNFYCLVTTEPAKNQPPLSSDSPYYVLVEALGTTAEVVQGAVESALAAGLVTDAVFATSEQQRQNLWSLRDDVEQCFRYAPNYTFDVSMRLSAMENYVADVNANLARAFPTHEVRNFTLGHMGDGNLHFVISVGEGGAVIRETVERAVYEPLAAIGGSVSGEHGIGLEKKPYLSISRSAAEIDLMRTLKQSLDPKGLLNPGKIFDSQ